ncbi:MAG: hypothetical protein ACRDBM_11975 [Sporomusa sp.]
MQVIYDERYGNFRDNYILTLAKEAKDIGIPIKDIIEIIGSELS